MSAKTAGMPNLDKIAKHWAEHDPTIGRIAYIGLGEPHCFRCGWLAPETVSGTWRAASKWLDRAHLEDYSLGGGNSPGNLVPLCYLCHAEQPKMYKPGERAEALEWVKSGKERGWMWQFLTDELGEALPARDMIKATWNRHVGAMRLMTILGNVQG